MMLIEAVDESTRMTHDFKMALIAADPAMFIPVAFPEWGIDSKPVSGEITDKDMLESEGEWIFTNDDDLDIEQIEEDLARALAAMSAQQTISAEDFDKYDIDSEDPDDDW